MNQRRLFMPRLYYYEHMIIYISALVSLIGLLAYALGTNGKVQEIGRIAYFTGLLAFLLTVAPRLLDLLR